MILIVVKVGGQVSLDDVYNLGLIQLYLKIGVVDTGLLW